MRKRISKKTRYVASTVARRRFRGKTRLRVTLGVIAARVAPIDQAPVSAPAPALPEQLPVGVPPEPLGVLSIASLESHRRGLAEPGPAQAQEKYSEHFSTYDSGEDSDYAPTGLSTDSPPPSVPASPEVMETDSPPPSVPASPEVMELDSSPPSAPAPPEVMELVPFLPAEMQGPQPWNSLIPGVLDPIQQLIPQVLERPRELQLSLFEPPIPRELQLSPAPTSTSTAQSSPTISTNASSGSSSPATQAPPEPPLLNGPGNTFESFFWSHGCRGCKDVAARIGW